MSTPTLLEKVALSARCAVRDRDGKLKSIRLGKKSGVRDGEV
jgi:hypothetical protein